MELKQNAGRHANTFFLDGLSFLQGKRGVDCGDPSDSQANCFAKVIADSSG